MWTVSLRLICLTFFIFLLPSCLHRSDQNQAYAKTLFDLQTFGDCIKSCEEGGIQIHQQQTLDGVLALLLKLNMIGSTERKLMLNDGWGRPYRWSSVETQNGFEVTIASGARNGFSHKTTEGEMCAIIKKQGEIITASVYPDK